VDPAALSGTVVTVLGPIEPSELGVCLPHEHIICTLDEGLDWSGDDPDLRAFAAEPVTAANLVRIQRDPFGNRANLRLIDEDEMVRELLLFAAAGGRAIVDQTTGDFGRDVAALRRIAEATGLHVVAGCGHYVADFCRPEVAGMTVDDLATEIVADLLADPGCGGVHCGVIGEIGVSSPVILEDEMRTLCAAARAQLRTGAPVSIHATAPDHAGLAALRILADHGVDPARVAVCHLDSGIDLDYQREVAREGAFLEYDWFGWTVPGGGADGGGLPHSDRERIEAVAELVGEGLADQLLLSHDIATKTQLAAYGGHGYAHLSGTVAPLFERRGVDAATLDHIMRDNPARWLTWAAPRLR
jgi:phosphotriesterase-related protein